MLTEIPEVKFIRYMRSDNSGNITVKICIFEQSKEKNHFSKTDIYFHKKPTSTTTLLGHIGLRNMKVGVKSNFGQPATIFQICAMDADIRS